MQRLVEGEFVGSALGLSLARSNFAVVFFIFRDLFTLSDAGYYCFFF